MGDEATGRVGGRRRLRTWLLRALLVGAVALSAWLQVGRLEVTPAQIASAATDEATRQQAQQLWDDALAAANAFLASDFRRSLPPGRLELDETDGMSFVTGDARLPLKVWVSQLGRIAVWSGAVAQECDGGFRVGPRGGEVPAIDHSWFRTRDGRFRSVDLVARTLLHELGHAVHRVGNFGVGRSLLNYGEIAVTLRPWAERSFERAPGAVSHEFTHWWLAGPRHLLTEEALQAPGSTADLDAHIAETPGPCEHGPAEAWALEW